MRRTLLRFESAERITVTMARVQVTMCHTGSVSVQWRRRRRPGTARSVAASRDSDGDRPGVSGAAQAEQYFSTVLYCLIGRHY